MAKSRPRQGRYEAESRKVRRRASCCILCRDENGTVNPDYEEFIDITLPEGIELMNRDGVKAEAGIATALIRIGERKGKARIIVSDGQLKGDMEVEIR